MHVLIAPDSFKESLSAADAARAIDAGLRAARDDATCNLCPLADGGEGTVDALVAATGGTLRTTRVTSPLGAPVDARWGLLGDESTAVIEMAQAAGLHLVRTGRRDPTRTTTFGVGELIVAALDAGCTDIFLGIGGSATCDGGVGMAQALGVRFELDGHCGRHLAGGDLASITAVDIAARDRRLDAVLIRAACDVTNPLTGPDGAAPVYAPQKGATPVQIAQLDAGLAHIAELLGVAPDRPGMGAAGGLGFGLVAFCGATLEPGIDLVMDAVGFDARLRRADLVLTGEGRLDGQSIRGKTCIGVARRAAACRKPCIALVGSAGADADVCLQYGLTAYHAIAGPMISVDEAMAHAAAHLERLAAAVMALH